MPNIVAPRLIEDDFSGDWKEDQEGVFRTINKFSDEAASAISSQIQLKNLGAQKIVLQSISAPTDWQTPTLASGVTNLGGNNEAALYRKDATGQVYLKGQVVRATVGTIFTLPVGFRPALDRVFASWVSTAGTQQGARLGITGAGVVSITVNAPSTYGTIECNFECLNRAPYIPACFPIKVTSRLKTGLASMILGGVIYDLNATGGQLLRPGDYSISWHNETGFDGNNSVNFIVIDNILGLIPAHSYYVELWALPEQ